MLKKIMVLAIVSNLTVGISPVLAGPTNGTVNPNNDQRIDFGWGGSGGGNLEMYSKTDTSSSSRAGNLQFIYGGGDFGEIKFVKFDGSQWVVKSKIDTNGNWAIGTENICPDCKLSVNGKIRATEIVVDSGWADYVFEPSYKLRPLEEVEAYIKENQHLPGVDSAATIEEKGLDLSKASINMMEKIEELTLYMIDLKKKNDQLQQEVAILKINK